MSDAARAKAFHEVKYASRKPVARNGANGTSLPILVPAGLRAKMINPTTAPIQNENMSPERACGPARSARPKTRGASARPIARPLLARWIRASREERRSAVRKVTAKAGRSLALVNATDKVAAINNASRIGGKIEC